MSYDLLQLITHNSELITHNSELITYLSFIYKAS